VYCCIGTTLKKARSKDAFRDVDYGIPLSAGEQAAKARSRQFLLVSAVQADRRSRIFYNRVKGETEQALSELELPSLQIFRPSLLLGKRTEFRLGEVLVTEPARALSPLMMGHAKKFRPVPASDVARAMVHAALRPPPGISVYEYSDIVQLAREAGSTGTSSR
jgi:uncharacterized protein YbjT (DUF2867 family)